MSELVHYIELTPKDFRERIAKVPVAYLPLGTLEWHGEHMPIGADGIQSQCFFEALAREVGGIVFPMLWLGPDRANQKNGEMLYGMDNCVVEKGHEQFYEDRKLDGSCYYVTDQIFNLLLESIALQLQRSGFKILVAHGHGPSTIAIRNISELLKSKYDIHLINCWGSEYDELGMGIQVDHGAMNETSLVMAFHPELVHMEYLSKDEWPIGIGGKDPRIYASENKGKEIVKLQKERMKKIILEALDRL